MTPWTQGITDWLADVFVHATVLLTMVVVILPMIRQPARRMTLAWGTLAGLVLVAVLGAFPARKLIVLPGWANVFNRPDRIQSEPGRNLPPVCETGQSLEVAETVVNTAKPQAERDRDEAIDEGINNAIAIDSTESSREFIMPEPMPNAEACAARPDSGKTAFDTTPPIAHATPEPATWRWSETALVLWTGGACLVIVWIGLGAWRTRRLDRRSDEAPGWMQRELRSVVPASRRKPRLRISSQIDAAIACGALRPAILLPEQNVHPAGPDGIRAALAHEWAHISHGDLWLLALERVLLPVYFAHPLFWVLRRRVRHDQELLADAAAGGARPVEYAEALLAWAKAAPRQRRADSLAALSLWNNPCTLARRIEMLLDTRRRIARVSRLWRGVTLTIVLSLACCLALVTFQPGRSIAEDPATNDDAQRDGATAGETQTTSREAVDPNNSDSAGVQTGDTTAQQNAALPSSKSQSPTGSLPGAADAEPGDPAASSQRKSTAEATPMPARPAVLLELNLMSVDHTKLVDSNAMSNILRRMSGDDKNVQIDGNVIVAKVPRENWRMMAKDLQKPGIGKSIADPVLTASLPWVVVTSNSTYESGGGAAVEFRHEDTTVRIRPLAVVGTTGIKLEASVDHKLPHKVARNAATLLRLSTNSTIEASGELAIGENTLVISFEPARTVDGSNLIAITPVRLVPQSSADSTDGAIALLQKRAKFATAKQNYEFTQRLLEKGYAAQGAVESARTELSKAGSDLAGAVNQASEPADVAALRQRIKNLDDEIRALQEAVAKGKSSLTPSDSSGDAADPEKELLRLDVQEAEVNYAAAKAEYDQAQQLATQKVISHGQLTAHKLKVDRAAIALERVKVRLKAVAQRANSGDRAPGKSSLNTPTPFLFSAGNAEASRALLELDVREAELDLAAARSTFEEAAQANARVTGSVPVSELSARKLAVQKAEIGLERAKLRLKAARLSENKEAESKVKDGQSSTSNATGREAAGRTESGKVPEAIQQRALARLNLKLALPDAQTLANGRFRGGMKVIEVTDNGLADAAGIRVGDILAGLGIYELVRVEDLSYVLDQWSPTDRQPLRFYVVRGNDVLQGQLTSKENGRANEANK